MMKFDNNGKMLYFAYGSNLNKQQMALRCPNARPIKKVMLRDHTLYFRANGRHCGVATIEDFPGLFVPGVLWEITPECLEALDRYEGYPWLYSRKMYEVIDAGGNIIKAMSYYMVNEPNFSAPTRRYYRTILKGYKDFNINTKYLAEFLLNTMNNIEEEYSI